MWLGLVLVLAVFAAYWPALNAGFVWDDDAYVVQNPLLTAPDGLWRIWFSLHYQSQYFPLTYTTLRIEHALWGLDARGYHFVNVLLHAANALLVWRLLRRLAVPGAWLAAAIFALHPVQVESVAWITELKNTQSTCFYLLALLAWIAFLARTGADRWRFYAAALLCGALALFSKTTACTLPAAMALIMWLRKEPGGWRPYLPITPFVAAGLALGLLSVWWEGHLGNFRAEYGLAFGPGERLLIASRGWWFYPWKLIWPASLTFSYPRWPIDPHQVWQYAWLAAGIGLIALLWRFRAKLGRLGISAILFYTAVIAPLLGFVSLYTFRYSFVADHYQYLACLGWIALFAAWATTRLVGRPARPVLTALLLIVLGALTWRHAQAYQNLETLWRDTVAKNPTSWMAHNNLGNALAARDEVSEAMQHYDRAIELKPDYIDAYNNRAATWNRQGLWDRSIADSTRALELRPELAEAWYNRANARNAQREYQHAIEDATQAVKLRPDFAAAWNTRGLAYLNRADAALAVADFSRAIELEPGLASAWYNRNLAWSSQGEFAKAVVDCTRALELSPNFAEAYSSRAGSLVNLGDYDQAIRDCTRALELRPSLAMAYNNRAAAYFRRKDYPRAWSDVRSCLQLGGQPAAGLVRQLEEATGQKP